MTDKPKIQPKLFSTQENLARRTMSDQPLRVANSSLPFTTRSSEPRGATAAQRTRVADEPADRIGQRNASVRHIDMMNYIGDLLFELRVLADRAGSVELARLIDSARREARERRMSR
jgi:hypothetical protein